MRPYLSCCFSFLWYIILLIVIGNATTSQAAEPAVATITSEKSGSANFPRSRYFRAASSESRRQ